VEGRKYENYDEATEELETRFKLIYFNYIGGFNVSKKKLKENEREKKIFNEKLGPFIRFTRNFIVVGLMTRFHNIKSIP
jgi:hypothetical protein